MSSNVDTTNRHLELLHYGVVERPELWKAVAPEISPDVFNRPYHQLVWSRLIEMVEMAGNDALSQADVTSLFDWCFSPASEDLRTQLGLGTSERDLRELLNVHTEDVKNGAGIARDLSTQDAIDLARAGVALAKRRKHASAIKHAAERSFESAFAGNSFAPLDLADMAKAAMEAEVDSDLGWYSIAARQAAAARVLDPKRPARVAVSTGLSALNDGIRRGFGVGELTSIALPTGRGKTLLAGAVCRSAIWPESGRPMTSTFGLRDRVETRGSDTRVLLWVGEDTADLVWKRIAQDILDADSETLDDPEQREIFFDESDKLVSVLHAAMSDEDCPVTIIDRKTLKKLYGDKGSSGRELSAIVRHTKRWAAQQRRDAQKRGERAPKLLAMFDYVQIVEVDPRLKLDRIKELRYVSQSFCDLAENEDIAVVIFAQMNGRLGHQSTDNNSMREAADIEHACHAIIYGDALSPEEVRKLAKTQPPCGSVLELAPRVMELTVRKGRNVTCSEAVHVQVDYKHQRISTLTADDARIIEDSMRDIGELPLRSARETISPTTKRARGNAAQGHLADHAKETK